MVDVWFCVVVQSCSCYVLMHTISFIEARLTFMSVSYFEISFQILGNIPEFCFMTKPGICTMFGSAWNEHSPLCNSQACMPGSFLRKHIVQVYMDQWTLVHDFFMGVHPLVRTCMDFDVLYTCTYWIYAYTCI